MRITFKIFFLLALLPLVTGFVCGQTNNQTKDFSPEAEKASVEVVKLFKQQKYKEALPFAQQAVELNTRELGVGHVKTAQAYTNLGYVQIGLDKKKEAATAFEAAVTAFDQNSNLNQENSLRLASVLESLGYLKFELGKQGGSEKYYRRALELREKFNGPDAPETIGTVWSLGNLNGSVGDNEQAAAFYRRVYEVRLKKLGVSSFDTSDALNRCRCSLLKAGKIEDADNLKQDFDNLDNPDHSALAAAIAGGQVNGKAVKLTQPPYPQAAKADRASGKVDVKVTIDESGKVIYACGAGNKKIHPALIMAAEWAAYNSKFTSTIAKDKPVKVTGVIVYNFVAR